MAPTYGPVPGGLWFGEDPDPGAARTVTLTASPSTIADPGGTIDLEAAGYDAGGIPVATKWAWEQAGSGTEGPWSEDSSYKGHLWNLGGPRAQWIADWGNARAGAVTVTVRAASGATASVNLAVRNVPPVLVAASASPVVSGSNTATSITVAPDTTVVFELRYADGNGVTEPTTLAANRWVFKFSGLKFTIPEEGGSIEWNLDPESRSYGYTTWIQPIRFATGQSGSVTFTARDGDLHVLEHTWQVKVQ